MMNVRLSLASTSTIALVLGTIALPASASAQTESTQIAAQEANVASQCADVSDASQRQECIDRTGEGALPVSGAPTGDEIIVTGSRIARANFDTIEPAVVINSEQIEARGFETLGQALNELPAFGVPGSSPVGGQAGSFGSGQSFVNFLGLGSERTLTLVNGRRFVGSNTASIFGPTGQGGNQVDLNVINTKLVDRVETIVIGGAPIYGSDAIAGTVNVILKRDFEGFELDAQYGVSQRGDAPNYRIRGIGGLNFADGRGNVVLSGEFNEGTGLVASDRAGLYYRSFDLANDPDSAFTNVLFDGPSTVPFTSKFGVPTRVEDDFIALSPSQAAAFGFQPGFTDTDGNPLAFDRNGNLIRIDYGQPVGPIGPDGLPQTFEIFSAGGNGFNLTDTSNLLTNTKRFNANVLASFEITDNVRFFGEGWYSRSTGTNLVAQPEYNSRLFDVPGRPAGPIVVSVDNPFLSDAAKAIIQDQTSEDVFLLERANTDLISGRARGQVDLWRVVGGLDGKFSVLPDRDWKWELVYNYGRSKTTGRNPSVNSQNFFNALDAVKDGSGNIICNPGFETSPFPTLSSTCAPLNPFGANISQAARDYVTSIAKPVSVNTQKIFTASLAGGLFALPGGDLAFALGYERRIDSQKFDPGAFYLGGPDPDPLDDADGDGDPTNDRVAYGQSVVIVPVSGEFKTNEFFGELRAPLIQASNNVPGIYALEFQGAARYVKNSIAGNDLTWTTGASYQPIRDLTFRGNYTRAIRAPFVTEAFNPRSSFFGFATDPCDRNQLDNGPDPATRRANCAAAGIPTNFDSLSDNASFLQAVSGNPNLSNEKSDAWTVGIVTRPSFLRGFTASVDYVDIKVKDVITQFSSNAVVAGCYDSPSFPGNDFCSRITRANNNQLSFIETGYFNAASLRYKGFLGAIDYRFNTPFLGATSKMAFNGSFQRLKKLSSKADAQSAESEQQGTIGYSRTQISASLNYINEGFGTFLQMNYFGPAKFSNDEAANFRSPNKVKEIAFVNAGVNYDIGKKFGVRFVVDNLFDVKPPFPSPAGGGTVTYFPGVLGRYFRVGASVGF